MVLGFTAILEGIQWPDVSPQSQQDVKNVDSSVTIHHLVWSTLEIPTKLEAMSRFMQPKLRDNDDLPLKLHIGRI